MTEVKASFPIDKTSVDQGDPVKMVTLLTYHASLERQKELSVDELAQMVGIKPDDLLRAGNSLVHRARHSQQPA